MTTTNRYRLDVSLGGNTWVPAVRERPETRKRLDQLQRDYLRLHPSAVLRVVHIMDFVPRQQTRRQHRNR